VYSQHQLGPGTPDCPVAHRTESNAPGESTVNQLFSGNDGVVRLKFTGLSGESSAMNSSLSENGKGDVAIIHRTVRWYIGLSGEPTAPAANGRPRDQRATRGQLQRSAGCTGLSGAPNSPEEQRSDAPDLEGDRAPDCYSSCPVVHRTVRCTTRQKARLAFQDWSPTTPSCLGAMKGTPRRMEQNTKLSRNILRLPDSVSTHLIRCVSYLSSVSVANSMCCVLSSIFGLCAWLCCGYKSCVCCSPNLTLVLSL
jgi:hypothetical protein